MSASRLTIFAMVSFLVGLGLGSLWLLRPSLLWYLAMLALVVSFYVKRQALFLILFFLIFGCTYISLWRQRHWTDYDFGRTVTLSGVITEPVDIRSTYVFLTLYTDQPIGRNRSGQPVRGFLHLKAPRYPVYDYGDQIKFRGKIEIPEPFNNFNYPLYLERFQIYGEVWQPQSLTLINRNRGSPILASLYRLREQVLSNIQNLLPEPEASFLGGILLGSKRAIPTDIQDALRTTGTVHIIVMSGSNITILLEILLYCLPLYRPKSQFHVICLCALFVIFLSGAPASVLRGAAVAILGRFIRLHSRMAWPIPFTLLCMTVLLLGNPLMLVADPGFQISFAAFAGLAFFSNPILLTLQKFRLSDTLRTSTASTLGATLGIAGVSLRLFGQLSFLGLLINPVVLWLLVPITFLGLIAAMFPFLGWLLKIPLWFLLHLTLQLVIWLGKSPFGILHLQISWFLSFIIYLAIFFLIRRLWPAVSW